MPPLKAMIPTRPTVSRMLDEMDQTHRVRQPLIKQIQDDVGRNIVTFFTSTHWPVTIEDMDNDMIEGLLQCADPGKGLSLILNSPGGSALAAERIINTCRTYSNGDFEVIVPRMAKSAATMICMGANKVWMSRTAELGPIDPQVVIITGDGTPQIRAAYYIIDSYSELFEGAIKTDGNIDPFLQQLQRYDARDIREYKRAVDLGVDIAVKSLKTNMMQGQSAIQIKRKIMPFIDPEKTKTHGRPIYIDEAKKAGLVVEEIDIESDLWKAIWELYLRSERLVNGKLVKLCESTEDSFHVVSPFGSEE